MKRKRLLAGITFMCAFSFSNAQDTLDEKSYIKAEVPIYLIQGEKDLLTPLDITTPYFEQIEAPDKKLFVVPEAAHGFSQAVIDTAYAILSTKVLPAIRAID